MTYAASSRRLGGAWGLLEGLCEDSCHHFSMCGRRAGEQGTLWHAWHMLWQVSHAILYWDWRTLNPAHWALLQALKHCKACTGTEHLGIQSCRDALCHGWQAAGIGTYEGGLRMQLMCEALSYDAESVCCGQGCLLPLVSPRRGTKFFRLVIESVRVVVALLAPSATKSMLN